MTAFLSSDAQIALFSVTVLFRAIASRLSNLEEAVSKIELAAAECLLQRDYGTVLSPREYQLAMEQRFARLFAITSETALQARRTAREVMAHPVYGLGSGPDEFGQPERDELASGAGLSQSQLALL
jgi:hypothetical protein